MTENYTINTQRFALLTVLWGILFSKCFALEYLVRIYEAPVNTVLYVWTLSISMAAVATFVYARLRIAEEGGGFKLPQAVPIWAACAIAVLLIAAASFSFQPFPPYLTPALLAVIMGLGYSTLGFLQKRNVFFLSGFGWWFGAAVLFSSRRPESLSLFSLFIILFTVLPPFVGMVQHRKELKAAVRALEE